MPATSSATVTHTVTRVVTDHDFGLRHALASSKITGNPRPPTITAPATVSMIHASPTKPVKLSEYSPKPALLNAEIAWKTP